MNDEIIPQSARADAAVSTGTAAPARRNLGAEVKVAGEIRPFAFEVLYELPGGELLYDALLDEDRPLQLRISNILLALDETVVLNQLTQPPDQDNYHFRLQFKAGVLASGDPVANGDWNLKRVTESDGVVSIYLGWKSASKRLEPGDTLVITFNRLTAASTARPTAVMKLDWPEPDIATKSTKPLSIEPSGPGQESDYELESYLVLRPQKWAGRRDITLEARWVGPNQVLNVENAKNTLTLRLTNIDRSAPISFAFNNGAANRSMLMLLVPAGSVAEQPLALATKDQLNGTSVETVNWEGSSGFDYGQGLMGLYLKPRKDTTLGPGEFIDITLKDIVTAHPSGRTDVRIEYSGIPGHRNGSFAVPPIEKAPLIFGRGDQKGNVGIGYIEPDARLAIRNGPLRLHNAELQNAGQVVIRSDSDDTGDAIALQVLKRKDTTPLLELRANNKLVLGGGGDSVGKLRVNGTSGVNNEVVAWFQAQSGTNARVELPGELRLCSYSTNKTAFIQARDDVDGNDIAMQLRTQKAGKWLNALHISPEGRVQDKTGFLVPVGTVFAYAGAGLPTGWLWCTGGEYNKADYPELADVVLEYYGRASTTSKFKVPDLRGRVAVSRKDGGAFNSLGTAGGAETHTLTAGQMPKHRHTLTDPGHKHRIEGRSNKSSSGTQRIQHWHSDTGARYPESETATTGISMAETGNNEAHNNLQPYLVINYIIKF